MRPLVVLLFALVHTAAKTQQLRIDGPAVSFTISRGVTEEFLVDTSTVSNASHVELVLQSQSSTGSCYFNVSLSGFGTMQQSLPGVLVLVGPSRYLPWQFKNDSTYLITINETMGSCNASMLAYVIPSFKLFPKSTLQAKNVPITTYSSILLSMGTRGEMMSPFSLNFTSITPGGEFYVTSWAECCVCGMVPSCFMDAGNTNPSQQYGGNGEPIPALGSFLVTFMERSTSQWMQVDISVIMEVPTPLQIGGPAIEASVISGVSSVFSVPMSVTNQRNITICYVESDPQFICSVSWNANDYQVIGNTQLQECASIILPTVESNDVSWLLVFSSGMMIGQLCQVTIKVSS